MSYRIAFLKKCRGSAGLLRSHCSCDDMFFDCLKASGDEKALAVGNLFFNVFRLECAEAVQEKICVNHTSPPSVARLLIDPLTGHVETKGRCVEWAEVKEALPQYRFREHRRKF